MPAQPELGLHANRKHSVPSLSKGARGAYYCFSTTSLLTGKVQSAFGSGQSMAVCTDGEESEPPTLTSVTRPDRGPYPTQTDPDAPGSERSNNALATTANTWPKLWFNAGRIMRVPKTVILSSVPFWPCWWPSTYFFGNRDVIGFDSLAGLFTNYYYFDQWNTQDIVGGSGDFPFDSTAPDYTFTYGNPNYDFGLLQTASGQADDYIDTEGIHHLPNTRNNTIDALNQFYGLGPTTDELTSSITIQAEPDYIAPGGVGNSSGPVVRYSQVVGMATNGYYESHQALIDAFRIVKKQLESNATDPIFVIIPGWMPYRLYQCYNSFLNRQAEQLNGAHGGAINGQPCNVSDAVPCYNYVPQTWNPVYPEVFDPRNAQAFNSGQVPWLSTADPGFGTNVLHLYIGHPVMKFFESGSIFDYQAFPLTPEVQWIAGSVYQGAYTGSAQPYFAGRRDVWDSSGFDYGYTGIITPESLYEARYRPIVENAATQYKQNFYNYRNFTTRLYTYNDGIECNFSPQNIKKDQENNCPSTQFFFGFNTFAEFAAQYDTEDHSISDCEDSGANPPHLKYGEALANFPDTPSLLQAITLVYPGIMNRITAYYASIDPGAAEFYQLSVDLNDLDDYNVNYKGSYDGLGADPDAIIEEIRDYFSKNP